MIALKSQVPKIDRVLFFLVICLSLFGVLMVYNSSVVTAFRDFNDKYFYARQQLISFFIGFVGMLIASRIDYRVWQRFAPAFLLGTVFLLFLVLIPGIGTSAMGARRWLRFGFSIQPAEIAKMALILYFSSLLTRKNALTPFIVILGLVVGLVMLEPDLGTTVVIVATSFSLYFASGAPLTTISSLGAAGLIGGMALILGSDYRRERLLTFFDTGRDPLGASYHIRQVLIALGSGGLFGVGLGSSRQKYEYLPESMTDSIFAVIGEETGFIGSSLLVIAFLLIIWRGFKIAREAPDNFGQLLAIGITSWIAVQALVNFAAMVALAPLTGIPLPFISFGGSALIMALSGVGILLNISRHRTRTK